MLALFEETPALLLALLFPMLFGFFAVQGAVDAAVSKARPLSNTTNVRANSRRIGTLQQALFVILLLLAVSALALIVASIDVVTQTLSGPGQFAPVRALIVLTCVTAICELIVFLRQYRRLAAW